jgi:hypothetical protein
MLICFKGVIDFVKNEGLAKKALSPSDKVE